MVKKREQRNHHSFREPCFHFSNSLCEIFSSWMCEWNPGGFWATLHLAPPVVPHLSPPVEMMHLLCLLLQVHQRFRRDPLPLPTLLHRFKTCVVSLMSAALVPPLLRTSTPPPPPPASRVLRKVIVTDLYFLSEVSSEVLLKVKPELLSASPDTTSLFFYFAATDVLAVLLFPSPHRAQQTPAASSKSHTFTFCFVLSSLNSRF